MSFDQRGQNHNQNLDKTEIFTIPETDTTLPDLMSEQKSRISTLTIVKGPQAGETFSLDESVFLLGRDPNNNIFLNDMTVSRHHARIDLTQLERGIASIEDLGSLNGTWVNGTIITSAPLVDGSTIQIGTFRMIFHTQQRAQRIETEVV